MIDVRDHVVSRLLANSSGANGLHRLRSASEAAMTPAIARGKLVEIVRADAERWAGAGEALGTMRQTISVLTLRTNGRRITKSRLVCGALSHLSNARRTGQRRESTRNDTFR